MNFKEPSNELAQAASAYLRSAAHQPVNWREWGEQAFTQAREQDKPILLDIGAVWCHWCHVMDRESYENPEVARLINEHYVAVKVDRDERPDIDSRYQTAISALSGQGGWPLTAFLTPEGKPFYGGTYFPPEDQYGRPGMRRVLEGVAHSFKSQRAQVLESAQKISEALAGVEHLERGEKKTEEEILKALIESIGGMYDEQFGGFGNAPKFPHPSALDLLLEASLESSQTWLLTVVTNTLEHMGRGGVYDQLGGGFHRYAVDERWMVPHFEKMAYDNAGLLLNYLHAYQATGNHFSGISRRAYFPLLKMFSPTRRADSTPARTLTTAWKMMAITSPGLWRRPRRFSTRSRRTWYHFITMSSLGVRCSTIRPRTSCSSTNPSRPLRPVWD
jgi:hypothetical protein